MDLGTQTTKDFAQQLEDCRAQISCEHPAPTQARKDRVPMRKKMMTNLMHTTRQFFLSTSCRSSNTGPNTLQTRHSYGAVGYYIDPGTGRLTPDRPDYEGRKVLQIIECKFATDLDMHEVINRIPEL